MAIGVCGWCIDRADAVRGIEVCGKELGLGAVQIGFFTEAALRSAEADVIAATLRTSGVTLVGSFIAFEGEDYASIERITATGGFMPGDHFGDRLALTEAAAALTAALGAPLLAIHAGTVPTDTSSPVYGALVDRVGQAADAVASYGVRLLLETGREPVEILIGFIDAVGRANVGVNFDPGNLVIYGVDDPIRAVSKLRGRIDIVHLKDARQSLRPGASYGKAASLGMGDAQIARVVSRLRTVGYRGPLLLEMRSRDSGFGDLRDAVSFVQSLLSPVDGAGSS